MSVSKDWLLGGWYPWGLIVHHHFSSMVDYSSIYIFNNFEFTELILLLFQDKLPADCIFLQNIQCVIKGFALLLCFVRKDHTFIRNSLKIWIRYIRLRIIRTFKCWLNNKTSKPRLQLFIFTMNQILTVTSRFDSLNIKLPRHMTFKQSRSWHGTGEG
jgi:hypothetical protein